MEHYIGFWLNLLLCWFLFRVIDCMQSHRLAWSQESRMRRVCIQL